MSKVLDVIDQKISPIADKLANNRVLKAVANGMMLLMPVTMVASFFSMAQSLASLVIDLSPEVSAAILMPYNLFFGCLALLVAFTVSYKYSESYGMNSINVAITSVVTFLVVAAPYVDGAMSTKFLGYAGIFTAVLVAILSVELERFLLKHKISIKLPDSVPPWQCSPLRTCCP